MSTAMFYEKPAMINKERHGAVRVRPVTGDYAFSARTNSVILATVEFTEACREYPIVFARNGEGYIPVALVGLRNDENLCVGNDGKWAGRYIPAYVRRYPFVLANADADGRMAVCIDEAYKGYGDADGEPLFDQKGEHAPLLKGMMGLLQHYQVEMQRTEAFIEALKKFDLFKEMSARAELPNKANVTLSGFYIVDEARLQQLPEAALGELMRTGHLAWAYAHLISLGNIARLSELLARRTAN